MKSSGQCQLSVASCVGEDCRAASDGIWEMRHPYQSTLPAHKASHGRSRGSATSPWLTRFAISICTFFRGACIDHFLAPFPQPVLEPIPTRTDSNGALADDDRIGARSEATLGKRTGVRL